MTTQLPSSRRWHEALDGQTLLLVDHHPVFAEVLARSFFRLADVRGIHLAHDLATARVRVGSARPDVVLLDSHLGPESGLDLLSDVVALGSGAWVIMVSGSSEASDVAAAFARGAHGWVSKRGPVEDVLDAVVAARRGEKYLATNIVGSVMELVTGRLGAPARLPTFVDDLTRRERDVLECLLAGMSRKEVATRLFLSLNTVRTHVQNILRAADVHSTLALLAAAREAGMAPAAQPQDAPAASRRTPTV